MAGRPTRRRVLSWACLPLAAPLLRGSAFAASERHRTWSELTEQERAFVAPTLPPADGVWSQGRAVGFIRRAGTRTAVYAALGMLLRDEAPDAANAATVVREVLRTQRVRPGATWHGVWPRSPRRPMYDSNWREFVGLGLITIRELFGDALGVERAAAIDEALVRAAEGTARRAVPTDWTNVALMRALLLDWAGRRGGRPELARQAADAARAIDAGFQRHGTFCEYNSPSYAGVDALALAMWRRFAPSDELRAIGGRLEASLWTDLATFYHPALRNLCGPFGRAYGMDMTAYPALAGLPIAMAANLDDAAPWPAAAPAAPPEQAYASLFAACPPEISAAARANFADFGGRRCLERAVQCGGGARCDIAAVVEPSWMMGAAVGMTPHGDQHRPATIHWLANRGGNVGWLTFAAGVEVDARIEGDALIASPAGRAPAQLGPRVWLHAPGVAAEVFNANVWQLPGITLAVSGSVSGPTVRFIEAPRLGPLFEVSWQPQQDGAWSLVLEVLPRRRS